MINIVHIANGNSQLNPDGPFGKALLEMKDRVALTIIEQAKELSEEALLEKMREADILLTMWGAAPIPAALAEDHGKVRYILNLTGTCRPCMPIEIIRSSIPVTNWGDAPSHCIAEGAMALLLAVLKDLRTRIKHIRDGEWGGSQRFGISSGTLGSVRIGIYGCGAIGRKFVKMVEPFNPKLFVYDPYAEELPDSCQKVDSLKELFEKSEAIVIHAGLSDETCKSVNAEMLAMLPDNGIVINTARGDIIDQEALFAELKTGRLRAGLDVLNDGDSVPADHESRQWPNLIMSCHDVSSARWPQRPNALSPMEIIALANLERFLKGEPLKFIMDERRFSLST